MTEYFTNNMFYYYAPLCKDYASMGAVRKKIFHFWAQQEWMLPLRIYVDPDGNQPHLKPRGDSTLVAEMMLIYMPSVEVDGGEALELLKLIGYFAGEQDVFARAGNAHRPEHWATSRLITMWNTLVLAHETLDECLPGCLPFMGKPTADGVRRLPPERGYHPREPQKLKPHGMHKEDRVFGFLFLGGAFTIDHHKTRLGGLEKSKFRGCLDLFDESSRITKDLRTQFNQWLDKCANSDVTEIFSKYDAYGNQFHHKVLNVREIWSKPSGLAFAKCFCAKLLTKNGVKFEAGALVSVGKGRKENVIGIFEIICFYTATIDGHAPGQKPHGAYVQLRERVTNISRQFAGAIGAVEDDDNEFYWRESDSLYCKVQFLGDIKSKKQQKEWYEDRVAKCIEIRDALPEDESAASSSAAASSSSAAAGTWSSKSERTFADLEQSPAEMVFRTRNFSRKTAAKDYVMRVNTRRSKNAKVPWCVLIFILSYD